MIKYLDYFKQTRVDTIELKKPEVLEAYKARGFIWIRKLNNFSFENILRNRTIGCVVELFCIQKPYCVSIDSLEARKLINKLCYF
jgi:hypothetical protein